MWIRPHVKHRKWDPEDAHEQLGGCNKSLPPKAAVEKVDMHGKCRFVSFYCRCGNSPNLKFCFTFSKLVTGHTTNLDGGLDHKYVIIFC